MPYLSIVTPAYNRASLLPVCYQSLLRQTDCDFEWIIVDDGSTDATQSVVRGFTTDKFPVIYVQKPNGGKHTALNASHEWIRGRYVLILDSDDALTDSAVEQIRRHWDLWQGDARVGVLTFLRGKTPQDPLCVVKDWNTPVDIMSYPRKIIHSSDCCEVTRTELFKKHPFPVFPNERFLSEAALWNRLSFDCKCVYIQSVVYLCEYLEQGLTRSGRRLQIENPCGAMHNANTFLSKKNGLRIRVKNALLYTCYGYFRKMKPREMQKGCREKALLHIFLPFGWFLYLYWSGKYGKRDAK